AGPGASGLDTGNSQRHHEKSEAVVRETLLPLRDLNVSLRQSGRKGSATQKRAEISHRSAVYFQSNAT
ncbi:MAG TPA: hypothetical protein VIR01_04690, partial [Pyrinomonadaceae bacterium]